MVDYCHGRHHDFGFCLFGFISAAFLCAIFGVLGVVLGICCRNKVPAAATLAAGAVVVLASWIGQAFAAMYILNVPPMIFGGEAMDSMEQQMMAQMAQFIPANCSCRRRKM